MCITSKYSEVSTPLQELSGGSRLASGRDTRGKYRDVTREGVVGGGGRGGRKRNIKAKKKRFRVM